MYLISSPLEPLAEVMDPLLGDPGVEVEVADVELPETEPAAAVEAATTELVKVDVLLGVGGVVDAVMLPWRVTFGDVGALEVVLEVAALVLLISRSYTASLYTSSSDREKLLVVAAVVIQ
jgi:hypothetical protein